MKPNLSPADRVRQAACRMRIALHAGDYPEARRQEWVVRVVARVESRQEIDKRGGTDLRD